MAFFLESRDSLGESERMRPAFLFLFHGAPVVADHVILGIHLPDVGHSDSISCFKKTNGKLKLKSNNDKNQIFPCLIEPACSPPPLLSVTT